MSVCLSSPFHAVSHSTVKLPVASYQQRLQRMASELAGSYLPALQQEAAGPAAAAAAAALSPPNAPASGSGGGGSSSGSGGAAAAAGAEAAGGEAAARAAALQLAERQLAEIQRYLFQQQVRRAEDSCQGVLMACGCGHGCWQHQRPLLRAAHLLPRLEPLPTAAR